mmetsp:Transcript_9906/g.25204  ORF Transcript_9906/g.25204 Transcript_9906/m.25204 type:complete len:240 (-) Transcript_9906:233-952(-)
MAEPATGAAGDSAGKKGPEEARPAPKCQFPGCQADLSLLKRYNMRCKICDEHRLAESLTVQGVESRFCQQCNRFHQVDAFEKGKRGCKEKLEKHNKRRRYNRRAKAGLAEEPLSVPGLTNSALMPGGFLEDVSRQMQVPDDATRAVFSNMAAAAAAAGPKPAGAPGTSDAAASMAATPGGFPGGMQMLPGLMQPGGAQVVPQPGGTSDPSSWDPNNRQNFQQYMLLAAYAAYMNSFPGQ